MYETSRKCVWGHLCVACLCAAGASSAFTVCSEAALRLHLRSGVFSLCFQTTKQRFPFSTWSTNTCRSYLIFSFLPIAHMQPYLDTKEHAPIFCAGISRSGAFISVNPSCDNSNSIFQGRERRKKARINNVSSAHSSQKLRRLLNIYLPQCLQNGEITFIVK